MHALATGASLELSRSHITTLLPSRPFSLCARASTVPFMADGRSLGSTLYTSMYFAAALLCSVFTHGIGMYRKASPPLLVRRI
jgi:hypothetical protein